MRRTTTRLLLIALLALAAVPAWRAVAALPAVAAAGYTIVDLGVLPGGSSSAAVALNARGDVAGNADVGTGKTHPFLWRDGRLIDLGTLPGADQGVAFGLNDAGQVVGGTRASEYADDARAFLYRDGALIDLGGPGGSVGLATGINDAGQIVGYAHERAFVYRDGAFTTLPLLPGYVMSIALGINAQGMVVGRLESTSDLCWGCHAFLWRDGAMTDLGVPPGAVQSAAYAVNASGDVVGSAYFAGGQNAGHAILWQGGTTTDFGALARFSGINDAGQIVGSASRPGALTAYAALWQGGAATDLNTLLPAGSGWVLTRAAAINDAGQIAGTGTIGGQQHAFLLSPPVPQRCFPETGHCVRGRFLQYWQAHGGLAINGYPISDELTQTLEDGKPYTVQYFERVRMEYHPENPPPYDVLLGQFGRRILAGVSGAPTASAPAKDGYTYFQQTGHNVSGRFMAYWDAHGGLAQFGYPLSEEFQQQLEDGKTYTVQYFERARLEYHPENQPPFDVELGQFGRRILSAPR